MNGHLVVWEGLGRKLESFGSNKMILLDIFPYDNKSKIEIIKKK